MDFFGKNQRSVLDVTYRGVTHRLEREAAASFQAQVLVGRPFEFTFPGEDQPTEIDFNGLRTETVTTVAES